MFGVTEGVLYVSQAIHLTVYSTIIAVFTFTGYTNLLTFSIALYPLKQGMNHNTIRLEYPTAALFPVASSTIQGESFGDEEMPSCSRSPADITSFCHNTIFVDYGEWRLAKCSIVEYLVSFSLTYREQG
jgi:hypothetical protein